MTIPTLIPPSQHTRAVPFPGLIAHAPGPDTDTEHGAAFRAAVIEGGLDASDYFARSGVAELASRSGGLCTLWIDNDLAIYQNTNEPLVEDDDLMPSINTNAGLFGSFMGGLDANDPVRVAKREFVERILGNARFVYGLSDEITAATRAYLDSPLSRDTSLDTFCLNLTAYVDSVIPGILDLQIRPLTDYLAEPIFGRIATSFFEIASEAISKLNVAAIQDADLIVDLTMRILLDNYQSIEAAPQGNLIRSQFGNFGIPFSRQGIATLTDAQLKELGTLIVATYDTTALSLLWTIAYLETTPGARDRLLDSLGDHEVAQQTATMMVLEAIRLGGSNPTSLWRRSRRPVTILHRGSSVDIPAGTMFWLDRRLANRDPQRFARPNVFDPGNIEGIANHGGIEAASLLARNRYEINSFSMINTMRNPRKCPGRLFSVRAQALMLTELYRSNRVVVSGVSTGLMPGSAMPRPACPGSIQVEPNQ
ncbi:cytochrome P450 [Burkholderia gladioli]|uniref:cytochrome P450 n=1 Tax=Burkholderia gladioli TaxID=28095 RepID=UPI001641C9FE|nr:cytochrome P450 [Burkholderia gladioli]